jgi:hypothetical protein
VRDAPRMENKEKTMKENKLKYSRKILEKKG